VRLPRPVDRDAARGHVPGRGEQHPLALGRYLVDPESLLLQELHRGLVDFDPGEDLLVADPAPRILVLLVDKPPDRVLTVARDVGRHPLGDRDHAAADHEDAVVAPGHE